MTKVNFERTGLDHQLTCFVQHYADESLRLRPVAVVEAEYRRSVGQLYPAYEQAALHRPRRSGP